MPSRLRQLKLFEHDTPEAYLDITQLSKSVHSNLGTNL